MLWNKPLNTNRPTYGLLYRSYELFTLVANQLSAAKMLQMALEGV